MIETHPFEIFVPPQAKYLLLGSFVGKKLDESYDWYYTNGRNHFWLILEKVYLTRLVTKQQKQNLFTNLHLAIGDIIYQCERKQGTNLDNNLINIVYNIEPIKKVLKVNKIEKIYFSSRFVEAKFRKVFKEVINNYPNIEFITLPSPSPRYAKLTKEQKAEIYKDLLPPLPHGIL